MKVVLAFLTALLMLPVCATGTVASAADTDTTNSGAVSDVIAKVGDQTITFSEINIAINSSAIVGVSIPALGTPERDTVRIVVLDRFVSANLLYLDALKQGMDKDPAYQKAITRFSNAILAGLYRKRNMAGEIPVSEEEIQAFYQGYVPKDTELTDDVRLQIEARLRRQKLHERMAAADKTLRDDIKVVVHPENLDIKGDETRADSTPLAEVGDETITWGQMNDRIIAAGKGAIMADPSADVDKARRDALEREIDLRIMVQKARVAGLENDPVYQKQMKEYQKTLLTNMHREQLAKTMEPSAKELKEYYEANKNRFIVPESRKVQMVVVKTKEEADDLKGKIEAGELTMYVAARDHSIAANARQDLGEIGWVNRGEVVPTLDEAIFALGPGSNRWPGGDAGRLAPGEGTRCERGQVYGFHRRGDAQAHAAQVPARENGCLYRGTANEAVPGGGLPGTAGATRAAGSRRGEGAGGEIEAAGLGDREAHRGTAEAHKAVGVSGQ